MRSRMGMFASRSATGSLRDRYRAGCYASAVMLLGRFAELAACQKALSGGGGPGTAAAVITGPPGIGKTSLWRAVADSQPAGVMVLRTTGVPGGQAAFANLADLLDPVAGQVLPRLPAPQASRLAGGSGLGGRGAAAEGNAAGAGGGRCAAWPGAGGCGYCHR